jgi:membrane protein required for colicin V production
MNGLDFIFLAILAFTGIRVFGRGLLKEFVSVFGLLIALSVATFSYQPAAASLEPFIAKETYAAVTAYVLIFLLCLGGITLLGLGLQSLFQSPMLSGLGRLGGLALGLVKGAILCSLLLIILVKVLTPESEFVSHSRTRPYLKEFSQTIASLVPEELREEVEETGEAVKESWEDSVLKKLREAE